MGTKKPEQWLTVAEVAAILHVHDQTVRQMCRRGELTPTYKLRGKYWRISERAVADWQDSMRWTP
ncbi:helix-turn-helix domain-containing protein [Tsukamurella tyrosinosolvens]|uniref:helix-turn-helix domain-containing protein n=1 Tax=Tsukamurella tyrosinosolvens TaxID=57704 RepID=UPI001CE05DCD|nr:helix-turn-helix domain-containing protein [Tsukamurella tyrosinosolvens]MCA4996268.1 helix-turn-helix domain-containing protein [Tsukamurella tyrosinosolvens]